MSTFDLRPGTAAIISVLFIGSVALTSPIEAQQRPAQPPQQQQQQAAPPRLRVVPVDQGILDRWLILFSEVAPQLSNSQDLAEAKVRGIYERACRKANFPDIGQCHAIDDYLGVLISGVADDGRTFIDPAARAKLDLEAINADKQLTPQQKAEQRAEVQGFLATLPERIPAEHIALLNRNSKRVLDIMNAVQGPPGGPQGQPPAPQPGPAPKR